MSEQTIQKLPIKETVQLVSSTKELTPESSYAGWKYFLPDGLDPVEIHGKPAVFFAQISFTEIAKFHKLEGFPETGVLQWFGENEDSGTWGLFDPEGTDTYAEGMRVRLLTDEQVAGPGRWVDVVDVEDAPLELEEGEVRVFDYELRKIRPCWGDDINPEFGNLSSEEKDDLEDLGEPSGNHVGGFPFFIQGDPRPRKDQNNIELILQLDSYGDLFMWGDAGSAQLFGNLEALRNGDASGFWWDWACG